MIVLGRVLAVLASLVLAAHFLRRAAGAGDPILYLPVLVALALPLLLVAKRAWATTVLRVALLLGAVEWVRVALVLYQSRRAMGAPAGRMLVILGSVALVTALAALLVRGRATAGSSASDPGPPAS